MFRIVLRRIAGAIPSLIGVVVVTFLLSHALPGDPAVLSAGPAADAASVAQVRAHLGLDRSLPLQFLSYVDALAHGDLGQSLSTGQPVLTDLVQWLPASLELTFVALIFAIVNRRAAWHTGGDAAEFLDRSSLSGNGDDRGGLSDVLRGPY